MRSFKCPSLLRLFIVSVTLILASCGGSDDQVASKEVGSAEEIRGAVIDTAAQAVKSASEITKETTQLVKETTDMVVDKASEVIEDSKEVISEAVDAAKEAAVTAKDTLEDRIAIPATIELPEAEND